MVNVKLAKHQLPFDANRKPAIHNMNTKPTCLLGSITILHIVYTHTFFMSYDCYVLSQCWCVCFRGEHQLLWIICTDLFDWATPARESAERWTAAHFSNMSDHSCYLLSWNPWKLSFCSISISWKNSFSDISRKCILPNMIGAVKKLIFRY